MKLELTHLLFACLQRDFAWSPVTLDEVWLSVENPPKRVEAEYSSTLAFEIAAQAKRSSRAVADWEPTDVARRIATALGESTQLIIDTSARGHLNVVFNETWRQEFFDSIVDQGGAGVVSAQRLVTERASKSAELNFEPSVSHGSIAVHSVRGQRLLVAELCEQFRDFLIECGVSRVIIEEAGRIDAAESSRLSEELSDQTLCLLLARLANPELDSMAIRLGLYGSENIPWLLQEFSRVWRVAARGVAQKQQEVSEAARPSWLAPSFEVTEEISVLRAWREVDFCNAAFQWLARSHGVFLTVNGAVNREYYRGYFSHLLQGVKLFFGFYSHPNNRIALADSTRQIVQVLGEAVEEATSKVLLAE